MKCPLDLWIYQELLVATRPEIVIETGTWFGGSALYIAMLLEQIGDGQVITIDVEVKPNRPEHQRIKYLTGSSTDQAIVAQVTSLVGGKRSMVILDSDHRASFVYDELIAYSPLVQVGDYIIVEDTNVNGHPAWPDFDPGPTEALQKCLAENNEFIIDRLPEDPRIIVASPCSGHGAKFASAIGSMLADLALDANAEPLPAFRLNRFSRFAQR